MSIMQKRKDALAASLWNQVCFSRGLSGRNCSLVLCGQNCGGQTLEQHFTSSAFACVPHPFGAHLVGFFFLVGCHSIVRPRQRESPLSCRVVVHLTTSYETMRQHELLRRVPGAQPLQPEVALCDENRCTARMCFCVQRLQDQGDSEMSVSDTVRKSARSGTGWLRSRLTLAALRGHLPHFAS